MTTRERVEAITEVGACAGCHLSYLNGLGFISEDYDGFGRFRNEEKLFDEEGLFLSEKNINTSASIRVLSESRTIESIDELVTWLGENGAVHACFSRQYFRFSIGRGESVSDSCALEAMREISFDQPISAVMKMMAKQSHFIERATEEKRMKYKKGLPPKRFSRRKFLLGAGGAALALPLLPSLFPRDAVAAPGDIKRFVAIGSKHGGVWYENQYPNDALLNNSQTYRGQTIRQGALTSSIVGSDRVVSDVLQGPSSIFTEALVNKMNVIRGIDVPYYLAHHRGGHLGNFADNDANGAHGAFMQGYPTGTIDQFLAESSSFYPDLSGIVRKSVHLGFEGMSHTAANGQVRALESSGSSLQLFDEIFRPSEGGLDRRVVDDVNENYKRMLRRSMSAQDRSRLVLHLEMIDELERKLNVVRECNFTRPTIDANRQLEYMDDPVNDRLFWELMNDVIVAGFACDTFRIVTMGLNDHFTNYSGDWHQENAHEAHTAAIQPVLVNSHKNAFIDVFLDLAAKLDAINDDQNTTILDNTLMHWSHESGPKTHDSFGVPIVTAGGLNGTFSTGNYIDYSNRQNDVSDEGVQQYQGLLYNQWLANVLIGMEESPQNFEGGALNQGGWGPSYIGYEDIYANAVRNNLSERLPYLFA